MTLANWISISNKGTLIKNDDCSKNLEEDSVETAMERHREETHCIRREKEDYRIQFLLSFWYTGYGFIFYLKSGPCTSRNSIGMEPRPLRI